VLVEIPPGFVEFRPFPCLFDLGTSMDEAVLRRRLLGQTPLGLFAHGAEIDDRAHGKLGGHRIAEKFNRTSAIQKMEESVDQEKAAQAGIFDRAARDPASWQGGLAVRG
jgi:hypothetical protein